MAEREKMTKPITLPVKERDENMKCKLSPIGFHNFKYERYIWRELCLIRVSKCNYCKKRRNNYDPLHPTSQAETGMCKL